MAHFAEIDSNGIVLRVLVVDNSQEERGQEFLAQDLGLGGTWIQTSYNANIRGKFAGIGDIWDGENFISPIVEEVINEAKAAAESKLAALGLTADDLRALGL
jgi:hypothetical protein